MRVIVVHHTCLSAAEDRRAIICETALEAASGGQEREQKVDHMDVEAICRADVVFDRRGSPVFFQVAVGAGRGVFEERVRCRRSCRVVRE